MTAADLIAALQRLPQHLPVKVLLGTFSDADTDSNSPSSAFSAVTAVRWPVV